VEALIRLSTFAADPALLAADAALRQFQLVMASGVLYVDGGWGTLVRGLEAKAREAGVEIVTGAPVDQLPGDSQGTVLAVTPDQVERLTGWKAGAMEPARMACLDLGLARVEPNWARFALGLDCPMYLSMHSSFARVAPEGRAMVHIARYLGGRETASREQLEAFADLLLPGWKQAAEVVRYLPNMTVTHALPAIQGRPAIDAPGLPNVAIAGEWVGGEGMLTDAAVASALSAADRAAGRRARAA
jgi:phytoene dehydrogenase-like protein